MTMIPKGLQANREPAPEESEAGQGGVSAPPRPHALRGRKQSPEHIARRVAANKANPKWVDHARQLALSNVQKNAQPHSEEHKRKMSEAMKGKQCALGFKRSEGFRRKLADYWAAHKEDHNHYVDGKGEERRGERGVAMNRIEYRLWREAVFARDNWTCQLCGERGGKLNADHIKPWAKHPGLRFAIDNGRTLCRECHYKRHSGPGTVIRCA